MIRIKREIYQTWDEFKADYPDIKWEKYPYQFHIKDFDLLPYKELYENIKKVILAERLDLSYYPLLEGVEIIEVPLYQGDGQYLEFVEKYTFEDAPEEVKEKILDEQRYWNVEHEWYDFLYDEFHEKLEEIGLSCEKFYFSLDRDYYIDFHKADISDMRKLLKWGKIDLRTKGAKEIIQAGSLNLDNTGGRNGGQSFSTYYGADNYDAIEDIVSTLNDLLGDLERDFLRQLRESYEYYISDECLTEFFTNCGTDYYFTIDGKIA